MDVHQQVNPIYAPFICEEEKNGGFYFPSQFSSMDCTCLFPFVNETRKSDIKVSCRVIVTYLLFTLLHRITYYPSTAKVY